MKAGDLARITAGTHKGQIGRITFVGSLLTVDLGFQSPLYYRDSEVIPYVPKPGDWYRHSEKGEYYLVSKGVVDAIRQDAFWWSDSQGCQKLIPHEANTPIIGRAPKILETKAEEWTPEVGDEGEIVKTERPEDAGARFTLREGIESDFSMFMHEPKLRPNKPNEYDTWAVMTIKLKEHCKLIRKHNAPSEPAKVPPANLPIAEAPTPLEVRARQAFRTVADQRMFESMIARRNEAQRETTLCEIQTDILESAEQKLYEVQHANGRMIEYSEALANYRRLTADGR